MKMYLTSVSALFCAVLLVAGCATMGGGSAEDQVAKAVDDWKAGLLSKDVDQMMEAYSENFSHPEYSNKTGIRGFLKEAADMGYLEGLSVTTEDATIEVEGDTAVVYPLDVSGSFGTVTYELTYTKEDGGWKITSMEASGM